jgi:hypothetical protein
MGEYDVNYTAIIAATVAYMIIGFIWYSKWIFGEIWGKLSKEPKKSRMILGHIGSTIAGFIIASVLSYFIRHLHVHHFLYGAVVGFLAWLGFVMSTSLAGALYTAKPAKLFLIDTTYFLVAFVVMGGIIGGWL